MWIPLFVYAGGDLFTSSTILLNEKAKSLVDYPYKKIDLGYCARWIPMRGVYPYVCIDIANFWLNYQRHKDLAINDWFNI